MIVDFVQEVRDMVFVFDFFSLFQVYVIFLFKQDLFSIDVRRVRQRFFFQDVYKYLIVVFFLIIVLLDQEFIFFIGVIEIFFYKLCIFLYFLIVLEFGFLIFLVWIKFFFCFSIFFMRKNRIKGKKMKKFKGNFQLI